MDTPFSDQSSPRVHQKLTNSESVIPVEPKLSTKFKKAPDAPKRFKSAYIFFSAEKHKLIRAQAGNKSITTAQISKLVSAAWKELPTDEREQWETLARDDKARYDVEKELYKGPWKIPCRRLPKDSTAPKRPMSAFLAFANSRRAAVKTRMVDASNADLSRALATMWREAPDELRQRYIKEEKEMRKAYVIAAAEWKKKKEEEKLMQRRQREEAALRIARATDDRYHGVATACGSESHQETHGLKGTKAVTSSASPWMWPMHPYYHPSEAVAFDDTTDASRQTPVQNGRIKHPWQSFSTNQNQFQYFDGNYYNGEVPDRSQHAFISSGDVQYGTSYQVAHDESLRYTGSSYWYDGFRDYSEYNPPYGYWHPAQP